MRNTRARGDLLQPFRRRGLTQAYITVERARELVKTMYALTHTKPAHTNPTKAMPGMDEELLAVPGICLRWKRICTAVFCFFLPTPSNYLMKKNKTSKKFTTFNDEEKGRMVTLSYICRKSVYLSIR